MKSACITFCLITCALLQCASTQALAQDIVLGKDAPATFNAGPLNAQMKDMAAELNVTHDADVRQQSQAMMAETIEKNMHARGALAGRYMNAVRGFAAYAGSVPGVQVNTWNKSTVGFTPPTATNPVQVHVPTWAVK